MKIYPIKIDDNGDHWFHQNNVFGLIGFGFALGGFLTCVTILLFF